MSIHVMSAVFKRSKAKHDARLVLLALADRANDEGYAWPRPSAIARDANVSERTVRDVIPKLSSMGELKVIEPPTRQRPPKYRVLVGQDVSDIATAAESAGDSAAQSAGVSGEICRSHRQNLPVHREPPEEPSKEPGTPPPPSASESTELQVVHHNVVGDPKPAPTTAKGRRQEWADHLGVAVADLPGWVEYRVRSKERPPGHGEVVRVGGPVWDALASATGYTGSGAEAQRYLSGPVAELEQDNATPDEVRLAVQVAEREWEPRMVTPIAVARHFRGLLRIARTGSALGRRSSRTVQDIESLEQWGREASERERRQDHDAAADGGVSELGPAAGDG